MIMFKKSIIFLLSLFFLSASSQEIYKIGDSGIKSTEGLVFYSLPKTNLIVKVVCSRTTSYAGPYFAYAEELLGIKGLPSEDKTEWKIDSIIINSAQESDPEALYAFKPDKKMEFDHLWKFSSAGLIFDPSSTVSSSYPELASIESNNGIKKIDEFTIGGFVAEKFDTLYKTVIKDTMYVKIPVLKPRASMKSIKEKAQEAADMIMKIRTRKFELLMAEDDPYAEVNAMKYAINELDKIEKAFLEMFTGKKNEKSYTYTFQHTPEMKELNYELFRFSTSQGIVDKSVTSASAVILSYEREGRVKGMKDWLASIPQAKSGSIYYRIPDAAMIKLSYKGQVIAFRKLLISQFGVIAPYHYKK